MTDPTWVTALASLMSATVAVAGIRVYDRRRAQRQADADVEATEATTLQIVDRLARDWLEELEEKVKTLKERLDRVGSERNDALADRAVLLDHVDALEDHITQQLPPPPPSRPPLIWQPRVRSTDT